MSTSAKRATTNRIKPQGSPGPTKNTSLSRFNATKHALLAVGMTELDDPEVCRTIHSDLMRELDPVGSYETFLVQAAAVEMVKWTRVWSLEGQYITGVLHPQQRERDPLGDIDLEFRGAIVDAGIPAVFGVGSVQYLVTHYERYASAISNRLFRTLHELERVQRMRKGEHLPAPTPVDFSVPTETGVLDSSPGQEQLKVLPKDGENLPRPVTVDAIHADEGAADSVAAESEPQRIMPADEENSLTVTTVEVARRETGQADPPSTAWSPRPVSEAIWNERLRKERKT